jgi:hypothetical protein
MLELSLIAHDLIASTQRLEGELAICEPERFGTAGSDNLPGSSLKNNPTSIASSDAKE